jgi:hypothetical protein
LENKVPTWSNDDDRQTFVHGHGSIITASVGFGGRNLPDDVRIIQGLLNKKNPISPFFGLEENGILDDGTQRAIFLYQFMFMGMKHPDGRIDKHGATLRSLINDDRSKPPAPPPPGPPSGPIVTSVARPPEMRDGDWQYLLRFTRHHEFPVFNMYNTRGPEDPDVTCGIGHSLPDPTEAKKLRKLFFDKNTNLPATDFQIDLDWNAAKNHRRTNTPSNLGDYAIICQLRMPEQAVIDDMAAGLVSHLQTLRTFANSKDDFADFANFPAAARIFSASFAYGHIPGVIDKRKGHAHVPDYPLMRAAIRAAHWAVAAGECEIQGVSNPKNRAHKQLLLFAQQIKDSGGDPNTVPPLFL